MAQKGWYSSCTVRGESIFIEDAVILREFCEVNTYPPFSASSEDLHKVDAFRILKICSLHHLQVAAKTCLSM